MIWLAGLDRPWLLIIDNADDPQIKIEGYLPGGDRGCILLTSRRPALRHFGNVGQGYCQFEKLDEFEASDLLLKQAHETRPWSVLARALATEITKTLGYLPLALVCVGKAIAEGMTTLHDCIAWFEHSWETMCMQSKSLGGTIKEGPKNVIAPYEAMLQSLASEESTQAQDALELIKMFSFLHYDSISYQFLLNGATNSPAIESANAAKVKAEHQTSVGVVRGFEEGKPKSWQRKCRDGLYAMIAQYQGWIQQSVLPAALRRDADTTVPFDQHRLRGCLVRLVQTSLVVEREKDGGKIYSMHPLVQKWVRERPYMPIREQGLWCEAAITALNQCIPMPPLGQSEAEIRFRVQLVPHLDTVRRFQHEIEALIEAKRKRRLLSSFLLPHTSTITRTKALQFAKFSRVYVENGLFGEARGLLEAVRDYVLDIFGLEDERSVQIMQALSRTYFWLSQIRDAVNLQRQALRACVNTHGWEHLKTLKIMDDLGLSEQNRGRYKEALQLHRDALAGMQKILPPNHNEPDFFLCLANLGQVHHRYLRFEEAEKLQVKAVERLTDIQGKVHNDTLQVKEMLANTYLEKVLRYRQHISLDTATLESHAEDLERAYALQLEVLTSRRANLGKENNLSLWAVHCMGRIKAALGHLDEAEAEMRVAIEAGERNVGDRHLAVLAGKTQLARVIAAQGRISEAETLFQEVIDKNSYNKGVRDEGEHPDHLTAVWYYAGCCEQSGKPDKALEMLEGISGGLDSIGAQQHPFWQMVGKKILELENLLCHEASPLRVARSLESEAVGVTN